MTEPIGFLFDLDGVIIDSEPGYNIFWGGVFAHYYPDQPELHRAIKGQTLTEIYRRFYPDPELQELITQQLNAFEKDMEMPWVEGFVEFAKAIRQAGYRSCIVTSSNEPKMNSVFRQHPELPQLIDEIVTAEDFKESKPSPECYLKGAERLGIPIHQCIAFEDSLNGLQSARSSGAYVVGLTTSLPATTIQHLCHLTINNFRKTTPVELVGTLKIQ